jgi:NADPH:quinone reductase-like Zn-dependent oxidoreductase
LRHVKSRPVYNEAFNGLAKPKSPILGTDFAGIIESVGSNVKQCKVGDRVFGFDDMGLHSHTEYICLNENRTFATIPENTSYEVATASLEGAHYALNFINKVNIKPGDKIMINGATGGIGSALLQLCRNLGANITATCTADTEELINNLGASKTIVYTNTDFTLDTEKYDFVFDAVGKSTFGKCKPLLKPGGAYISSELGPGMQNVWYSLITLIFRKMPGQQGKNVKFPFPHNIKGSIQHIKTLLAQGKFTPVIDKTYDFEHLVEAFEYVDSAKKIGNVVITLP